MAREGGVIGVIATARPLRADGEIWRGPVGLGEAATRTPEARYTHATYEFVLRPGPVRAWGDSRAITECFQRGPGPYDRSVPRGPCPRGAVPAIGVT